MEMNWESKASKGAAATGIALGASALGLSVLRNGLGGLLGFATGCDSHRDSGAATGAAIASALALASNSCHSAPAGIAATRYDIERQNEITNKDMEIAYLRGRDASKTDDLEIYKYVDGRLRGIEAQICQQNVVNAQVAANLACMQSTIATLSGLTKTVVPITSICPTPAVATTAPATGA